MSSHTVKSASQFVRRLESLGFTIMAIQHRDGSVGWYWGDGDGIVMSDDLTDCLAWVNTNPRRKAHEASLKAFLINSGRVVAA